MKTLKKIGSLLLAVVMVMSLASAAFAAVGEPQPVPTYKITINNAQKNHTYTAYQIFSGTLLAGEGDITQLGDIEWGNGINGDGKTNLLNAYTDPSTGKNPTTALELSKLIGVGELEADAKAVAFGEKIKKSWLENGTTGTLSDTTYVIEGLKAGYYVIVDTYTLEPGDPEYNEDNAVVSRFMIQVVEDETVESKVVPGPDIEKKIDGETDEDDTTKGLVDANSVGVGSIVPYVLTSKVPDMKGYTYYNFMMTDTMTKGLTFNDDLKVTVGGKELNPSDTISGGSNNKEDLTYWYEAVTITDEIINASEGVYTEDDKGKTVLRIWFNNFLQYANQKDAEVKVTYSATVNEEAVTREINDVSLKYSNDPNFRPEPEKEPSPDDFGPNGETPKHTVYSHLANLLIQKTDENGNALPGASFTMKGTKTETAHVNDTLFVEDKDGEYWLLKDGTYTKTSPDAEVDGNKVNRDAYADLTTKYALVEKVTKDTVTETFEVHGVTDENGHLLIEGLSEGTYTITELKAPDGYNLLTEEITFTITESFENNGANVTWGLKDSTGDVKLVSDNTYNYTVTIKNNKGAELPETGGIGTTIFYIVGAILVIGAGVLLITKKRMKGQQQ